MQATIISDSVSFFSLGGKPGRQKNRNKKGSDAQKTLRKNQITKQNPFGFQRLRRVDSMHHIVSLPRNKGQSVTKKYNLSQGEEKKE